MRFRFLNAQPGRPQENLTLILWVVFFCYSICAALIFQKVVLPLMPSMHAGGGLMNEDAVYFDSVARSLAEQIRLHGWGSWQIYPANGARGNVAVLGALYALFGNDPTLIVPINAAVHASCGLLIFLLARELTDQRAVGTYAGTIAATLFVIFPTALIWYGQNHKDGYMIAGSLLILLSWLKAAQLPGSLYTWLGLLVMHAGGVLLAASVRPYSLKLLLIVTAGALVGTVILGMVRQQTRSAMRFAVFLLASALTLLLALHISSTAVTPSIVGATSASHMSQMGDHYARWQGDGQWQWRSSHLLPDGVERYIEIAARTRAGLIDYGVGLGARSMIDEEHTPQDIGEVATYLPRALQIALLAPFPSSWLQYTSMTRLVAHAEMALYYLCLPGVILLLLRERRPGVLLALYFACFFLLVYGFTQANLGTLYRYRFGYLFVVLLIGLVGWFHWLSRSGHLARLQRLLKPPPQTHEAIDRMTKEPGSGRKRALSAGILVMALTFLSFFGFFLRDVLMANNFGLGASLDSFFIALLIPMFLVTVLCIPLGNAIVPIYLDARQHGAPQTAREMLPNVTFWTTASLLLACFILYVTGPVLLPFLYIDGTPPDLAELTGLSRLALPILLFSGAVILGNSVLNALGRAVLTSTVQLIVPLVAILALLLFGDTYGVRAVMLGMVIGQILNLALVQWYLRPHALSLIPQRQQLLRSQVPGLLGQYLPLMISAFFVSAVPPVATLLAMALPAGSVSALNLGTKAVLFITGLVNAAVTMVMLPYFSSLISQKHLMGARRELSFFLLLATFVSIPASAALFVWADEIVALVFSGGSVDTESQAVVVRVMRYALVQLPFFVCNALLLKFAVATKHVVAIVVVALVGLLVNVVASLAFMQHMGVAGIALGGSISVLTSTVLLVLSLLRFGHIKWLDAVFMLLNWLLFVTLLVAIHFASLPSILVTMTAYGLLLLGYMVSLKDNGAGHFQAYPA